MSEGIWCSSDKYLTLFWWLTFSGFLKSFCFIHRSYIFSWEHCVWAALASRQLYIKLGWSSGGGGLFLKNFREVPYFWFLLHFLRQFQNISKFEWFSGGPDSNTCLPGGREVCPTENNIWVESACNQSKIWIFLGTHKCKKL